MTMFAAYDKMEPDTENTRLNPGGGQVYDRSSNYAAVVTCGR
jgi:hypothetical protein